MRSRCTPTVCSTLPPVAVVVSGPSAWVESSWVSPSLAVPTNPLRGAGIDHGGIGTPVGWPAATVSACVSVEAHVEGIVAGRFRERLELRSHHDAVARGISEVGVHQSIGTTLRGERDRATVPVVSEVTA